MAYDRSHMRIGDAERTRVAEALGKHFADGRLDKPEFDERMEKAMSAKTEADLAGPLSDLPRLGDQPAPVPEVAVRSPVVRRKAQLVVLALVSLVLLRWLVWWPWHLATPILVWPLVVLVGFALLRGRRRRRS
jgi:hypothetical protein